MGISLDRAVRVLIDGADIVDRAARAITGGPGIAEAMPVRAAGASAAMRIAVRFLEAAKVDDLIAANPDLEDEIRELSEEDPSKKGKYLEWSVKQLKKKAKMEDLVPTIQAFHENQPRFEKKDINQYKTLKELEDAVKALPESKTKEKARVKSEGSKKLWENDTHVLFRIETRDACIQYGKGTKWCITMRAHNYWESYKSGNNVFYFLIDKRQSEPEEESETFSDVKTPEQYAKIAWAVRRSMDDNSVESVTIFDARDKVINKRTIPGIPEFAQINQMVIDDAPDAPDGPIVSMRKGNITPKDLYDYLSVLDVRTLLANISYVQPSEQNDPVLFKILDLKKEDLSEDGVRGIMQRLKGGTPETDKSLLKLAREGVKVDLDRVQKGPEFDEILRIRLGDEPDFLELHNNARYIAKISDDGLRKELADKHRGRMAELGIIEDKDALEKLLHDEDPKVRESTIRGLQRFQLDMLGSVLKMVDDPDPQVRNALAQIPSWSWEKSGAPPEQIREVLVKLLHDEDPRVVESAVGNDLRKIDHEILRKLSGHPSEKVRAKFHSNPNIDESLKPLNDESDIVRKSIIRNRRLNQDQLDQMAKSENVNDRRLALNYVQEKGYGPSDSWTSAGAKKIREFASKLLKDADPQVRTLANQVMFKYGGKYDTEGFENSTDSTVVQAWIGIDPERAKSVIEKLPPQLDEWEARRVGEHAQTVLVVNEFMDYLSGKRDGLPEPPNRNLSAVTTLLPKEYLPKLLEKLPFPDMEQWMYSGVFEDLAKRMDKKYAMEILTKIPNPGYASTAVTALFKKLSQDDIRKFIDSDSVTIRVSVARRIDKEHLPELMDDTSNEVRRIVAERIAPEHLPKMMKDPDPKVRRRVAERIDPEYLEQMRKDKSIKVRGIVKQRLGLASSHMPMLLATAHLVAESSCSPY